MTQPKTLASVLEAINQDREWSMQEILAALADVTENDGEPVVEPIDPIILDDEWERVYGWDSDGECFELGRSAF